VANFIHTFAGNPLDRAEAIRRDEAAVAALFEAPDSIFLAFHRLNVKLEDPQTLAWLTYTDLPEQDGGLLAAEAVATHQLELTERQQLLREALEQLGARCRDLLLLLYYHRYTTEAAMHALDYKNKDVVKSQKARCMRQLRNWLEDHWDKDLI